MTDKDRRDERTTDRQPEEREERERKVAPPIEREHETQTGVFEEEEEEKLVPERK